MAFCTHLGLYEFLRLPFGLKTAPNTFQRILNTVFADYLHKWLVVYVNDIIQWSMTDEEALAHYSLLFQRLVQVDMQLKPSKCSFFASEKRGKTGTSNHPRRSSTPQQRSRSNLIHAHTNKHFCSQTFSWTLWLFQRLHSLYVYPNTCPAKPPQEEYIILVDRKTVSRLEASHHWPRCDVVPSGLERPV